MEKEYYNIIKQERTLLEKILTIFPGYKGYREKEILRETDQLIRNTLFQKLKNITSTLRKIYREILSSANRLNDGKKVEKLWMRMDAISEKILHAERGYLPLLNIFSITQLQIINLMNFDASLGDIIISLKNKVDEFHAKLAEKELFDKFINEIEVAITKLEETFAQRENVMMGLPKEE